MNKGENYMSENLNLPVISETVLPLLENITSQLGVPREVLAKDEEILYAWGELPRELKRIPPQLRNELLARMCVAVSTGLFDGAINYVWNASINNLRNKVRDFGYNVVTQIVGKNFDEDSLLDLMDAQLLKLCLELNLISEEGYYFLDQCRDIRNNYSAAHPSISLIDDREVINFISRCAKFALSDVRNPKGVFTGEFIAAIKNNLFSKEQLSTWVNRLKETHDAQRESLFSMLHGIYCDPISKEQHRLNSLNICKVFTNDFTPLTKSHLLKNHYNYQTKGDEKRYNASQIFFEKLGMLSLLNKIEVHIIITRACENLLSVHNGFNNFYNEPPFAERLFELSSQNEIPESAKETFVIAILTCNVGNPYGVSHAAIPYYNKMIRNLTPKEISIMLNILSSNTIVANRIKASSKCKTRYKKALELIDVESLHTSQQNLYSNLMKKL